MTIRHKLRTLAFSGVLLGGGIAIAPVSASSVSASAPVVRNDALAGVAANALSALDTYLSTGSTTARASYDDARRQIAVDISERLSIDAASLEQAWRQADPRHQQALMAALSQLGVPYRRNASSPGVGLDCSGLTSFAWAQADVDLPHQSGTQITTIARRTATTAQAGDIVHYPGHVMMYLGVPGAIVHSPYTGRTVEVDLVSTSRRDTVRYGDPLG